MPLTDAKARAAKPGEKRYEMVDGDGLALVVMPSGSKVWHLRYRTQRGERKRVVCRAHDAEDSHEPIGLLVAAMLLSGMRLGEALRLKWEDIDLGEGVIHVAPAKTDAGAGSTSLRLRPFTIFSRCDPSVPMETLSFFPTRRRQPWMLGCG